MLERSMQSESKLTWSLVSLALLVSVPAPATELRALASWDDTHPARRILLQTYLKSVETASKGDLIFKLSGPETVPPFEQLQPVGAGVFQLLFSHPGYHIGITPYLIPIDGLKGDSKTLRESGVYELIDNHPSWAVSSPPPSPPDCGIWPLQRIPMARRDFAHSRRRGVLRTEIPFGRDRF